MRVIMDRFIEVSNGIKLFVKDQGEGDILVFISGWPYDHRSWEYQFNQLSKQYRCIGIDLRGFGFSDKPFGEYSYYVFADDIHAVLQALSIKDAILIGHSMGGATTLHYAAKYQDTKTIKKIVLCGAAAPRLVKTKDFSFGMNPEDLQNLINLCDSDRAKLLTTFGSIFFHSKLSPELSNWFWITGMEASPYATMKCLEMFGIADLSEDMKKVNIPTLILCGKYDKVCPFELSDILGKNIKNAKLIPFENSGHGLFYDEREKFNKAISDFAK